MVPIVTNVDESFFRSVQLALDANRIQHVDSVSHFGDTITKYANCVLVDEEDFEKAREVVRSLRRTTPPVSWDRRMVAVLCVTATIVCLALLRALQVI